MMSLVWSGLGCLPLWVLTFGLGAVYLTLRHWCEGWKTTPHSRLPPGSLGLPVIGETLQFIFSGPTGKFFSDRLKAYGPVFKTHLLGHPTVCVAGSEHLRKLFTEEYRCLEGFWPASMRQLQGSGSLASCSTEVHRHRKRILFQAFRRMNFPKLVHELSHIVSAELESWHEVEKIEVYESAKVLTIKAACMALFGLWVTPEELELISKDLQDYMEGFFSVPLSVPGTTFSKALEARKRLKALLKDKLQLENNNGYDSSFLQTILADMKGQMEQSEEKTEQLFDETTDAALELLFGGQETLSCVLTCAMMLLKRNSEALQKLRDEVDNSGPGPLFENMCNEKYFDQFPYVGFVMKEIFRLYPPVGGGFRKAKVDINMNGFLIPKGWTVNLNIKSTQEYSPLFPDSATFNPDRWKSIAEAMDSSTNSRIGFHYLPFGAGVHVCVGKDYGRIMAKVFLMVLAQTLDWELLTPDPCMLMVPVVKPKDGLWVRVYPRNQ